MSFRPTFLRPQHLLAVLLSAGLAACGPAGGDPDGGEVTPDAGGADAGKPDGGGGGPDGGGDPGEEVVTCENTPILAVEGGGTCAFLSGQGDAILVRGTILTEGAALQNGHLLIGGDGKVECASCDCSADPAFDTAKVVACPNGVVSPGLINAHDHITFTGLAPATWGSERFDHRHDWRKGKRGHTKIPSPQTPKAVSFGELRQVLGGTTSLVGSGGAAGLLRNLDMSAAFQEGLNRPPAKYETFPLGDNDGQLIASGCGGYPEIDKPTATAIARADAYVPHVSEGIDAEARNEFLCVSGAQQGSEQLLMAKSAFTHSVGLLPQDYDAMAKAGTGLVWSPRSNISLYGHTAQVTIAARAGVQIALGTDWTASGSVNMLRELQCADQLNRNFYGRFFTDKQVLDMATKGAAAVLGLDDVLGVLRAGAWADVAVFDGTGASNPWRAVIDSTVKKTALVLRAGAPLSGDAALVDGLGNTGCEALDVCGTGKKVCAERETTKNIAALRADAGATAYGLFFCEIPTNEPTCLPSRPDEYAGQSLPTDRDGDGIDNDADNCPDIFNPARPVDGNKQGDIDNDGTGDACDPCPLAADATECPAVATDDRDFDGAKDAEDNCPNAANADQLDTDEDGAGDVCDPCPTVANAEVCPATIYQVKTGGTTARVAVTNALVTAVGPTGYFIAHVPGDASYDTALGADYASLFVFTSAAGAKPAVGDRIDVTGTAGAYFGQSQLSSATFTVKSSGNTVPAPTLVSDVTTLIEATGEVENPNFRAPALEGALVRIENVTITSIDPAPGPGDRAPTYEFEVAGGLRVNDYFYRLDPAAQLNENLAYVQGVLRLANDNYKIEPRDLADLGRPVSILSLTPAESWAALGGTGGSLTLTLTRTADADTTVTLSSSAPSAISVGSSVSVPAGQNTIAVPYSVLALAEGPVTVTATLGTTTPRTAVLKTYDPAAARTIVEVTLAPEEIRLNAAPTVTVTLDAPAGPHGLTFGITSSDDTKLAFPAATFTVAEGALTGSITGTALAEGAVTVTVTRGTDPVETVETFDVTVLAQPAARPPTTGELLVTEVMPNPLLSGTDTADEWFEVANVTNTDLILTGLVVSDNSANHTITGDVTIPAGAHWVFAFDGAIATRLGIPVDYVYGSTVAFVLANGGDNITLKLGSTTIDSYAWTASTAGRSGCRKRASDAVDAAYTSTWGLSSQPADATKPAGDKGSPRAASTTANCE